VSHKRCRTAIDEGCKVRLDYGPVTFTTEVVEVALPDGVEHVT
jgi:hypothetical protein